MPTKLALLREELYEDNDQDSEAARQAKQMGLVHLGYGNYGPSAGQEATHVNKDGKLVPVAQKNAGAPPHAAGEQPAPQGQSPTPLSQEPDEEKIARAQAGMFLSLAASPEKALEMAEKAAHSLLNNINIIKARGRHATGTKTYKVTLQNLKKTAAAVSILKQQLAQTPAGQSSPPVEPPEKQGAQGDNREHIEKHISANVIRQIAKDASFTAKTYLQLLKAKSVQGNVFTLLKALEKSASLDHTNMKKRQLRDGLKFLIQRAAENDPKSDSEYEKDRNYDTHDTLHFKPDDY